MKGIKSSAIAPIPRPSMAFFIRPSNQLSSLSEAKYLRITFPGIGQSCMKLETRSSCSLKAMKSATAPIVAPRLALPTLKLKTFFPMRNFFAES